jgi:catechol 2,3-dioxygenase-like lactoylglutathione lyase family enzyme
MLRKTKMVIASLLVALSGATSAEGLPGMRGTDHIGITVPDLKQAVDFFVNVIGCEAFYKLGPFKADNDWMEMHLNVNPKAEIPTMQLVRCGSGTNYEVFQWTSPDQKTTPPRNSDAGGHHLAFFVDDMAKAVAHLKKNNVKMFGDPTVMGEGPSAGESWMYFLSPWGLQMELVTYKGKAYEKDFKGKLWNPAAPGQ